MKLPELRIGNIMLKVPIIQGGMGACVSLSSLAGAVAKEGGMGVISAVHPGFKEKDFETNTLEANVRALKNEITKAKETAPNGAVGVNIMVAMKDYKEYVKAAIEAKADAIISGAGLPLNLPALTKDTASKIIPIVSSAKAALVISKMWDRKNQRACDAIIVEGCEAGGHLGFSAEELINNSSAKLLDIVKEVKQVLKEFEEKYNKKIPVIAAGGIFDGKDIAEAIKSGADGVQMATRFVATEECDADIRYKQAYINSKKEDLRIIKSPVGMPGRAIYNEFLRKVSEGKPIERKKCYQCITSCNPNETPYCISQALLNAVKGNIEDGLVFAGSNVYKLNQIVKVKELMKQLIEQAENVLSKE